MSKQGNGTVSQNHIWMVALAILCLGSFGFVVFYQTNTSSSFAFIAGQYLTYALFLWFVFYAAFLKKRDIKSKVIAFISIYTALLAGGLISVSQQKQQALQMISTVQKEISQVRDASVDSSGLPKLIEKLPATTPQARGEIGEMERFMKEYINGLASNWNNYLLELEAIGWNSALDPQRIKDDRALSESMLMVKRAKTIVDKYERVTADLLQNTRGRIASLNISESSKKEMLAGFDKGMRNAGPQIDKLWGFEKKIVLEVEKIFAFLAASKRWQVQDRQIIFSNEGDLSRYNAHIKNVQQMVQQQEQIQKDSNAELERKFESFKKNITK